MTPDKIIFLQNLFTFLGIAVLSIPVLSLDGRRKKLHDVSRIVEGREATGDTPAMNQIGDLLKGRKGKTVSDWRRRDWIALRIGYVMLLGASGSRLIWP